MTLDTINLLLATTGPVVVVGGVAATQFLLVGRQTGRINDQMQKWFHDQPADVQKEMLTDDVEPDTTRKDLVPTR